MSLLKRAPIGPAFAASHLEIISVLALSHYLFNEEIGWSQIVGCLFIIAGIICLALSETEDPDDGHQSGTASAARIVDNA